MAPNPACVNSTGKVQILFSTEDVKKHTALGGLQIRDQIPWWLGLAPWSFGFDSQTRESSLNETFSLQLRFPPQAPASWYAVCDSGSGT